MLRVIFSFLTLFLVIAISFPISTSAKTCKKYGPNGQLIHYWCPEDEPNYLPKWKTRTKSQNGKVISKEILYDSVCYNYPEGSIAYRECRREAQTHFGERCNDLKKKYGSATGQDKQEFKIDMDCFCAADRRFRP